MHFYCIFFNTPNYIFNIYSIFIQYVFIQYSFNISISIFSIKYTECEVFVISIVKMGEYRY